jgi:SAM-dependent methyltransferase
MHMADLHPDLHPGSGQPSGPEDLYTSTPPWDIGRPQPAFLALADAGAIRGRVLDVGCGTGEHVLMAAGPGLDATGVDLAALRAAEGKARDRGVTARFLRWDARKLATFGESFVRQRVAGRLDRTGHDRHHHRPERRPGLAERPHQI